MAMTKSWRAHSIDGPHRAQPTDIAELNQVFSDAFTERYRRDGMVGVRVPHLNPLIWRYAIEDAAEGAMVWRDERGRIAAFNMVHRSGTEGWMGPLAVRTELQSGGNGKALVARGVEWLLAQGARVVGLETMPRTVDNIGFYSRLGFVPGRLTITATLDATQADSPARTLGSLTQAERDGGVGECHQLVQQMQPGYDYSREIHITHELRLGDTVLLRDNSRLVGFALTHSVSLVEGRPADELRVLKLAVADEARLPDLLGAVSDFARRSGTRRVALRVQGEYTSAYQRLMAMGAVIRWTDLRMSLAGYGEARPSAGVLFSNWEI